MEGRGRPAGVMQRGPRRSRWRASPATRAQPRLECGGGGRPRAGGRGGTRGGGGRTAREDEERRGEKAERDPATAWQGVVRGQWHEPADERREAHGECVAELTVGPESPKEVGTAHEVPPPAPRAEENPGRQRRDEGASRTNNDRRGDRSAPQDDGGDR